MNGTISLARNCLFLVASQLVYNMSSAQNRATDSHMSMDMSMQMNNPITHAPKNIYLVMMDSMMVEMDKAANTRSAEIDFVSQMIPHHQGAVYMAKYEIQHGKSFEMVQLAKSILAEQQSELQQMRIWLIKHSVTESSMPTGFQREMDKTMSTMMDHMPATEKLDDMDRAFAMVMTPHHQAAVDMAKVVLRYAGDQQVIAFAKQLISNEQVEIEQMVAYSNAQSPYAHDRVYTANQVSNTVSVVDPANNAFLGEIKLGKPYPNVLNPLYKGLALVHGLRYCPQRKMLAVVGIGSNSVTLVSTETNKVIKTIYIGRSPHEPTFTNDGKQIWTSVRGEAYVSVIDVDRMQEVKRVPVADGPGMITFTTDGKLAYVCSSFTSEVDVVNTSTYAIVKRIPVVSPFSPNIFTSPDGKWIAMTHKDVGKVTVINTGTMTVARILTTEAITNHVTFCNIDHKLLMLVTIGGENKVRVFEVAKDFAQIDTISVGALPHGLWASADGRLMYVGLEYADQVQGIDLLTMKTMLPVQIGQSPQALVYASNAVSNAENRDNLSPLNDTAATQVLLLKNGNRGDKAVGRLAVRSIGLADLVEQIFTSLKPNTSYTLALSRKETAPFNPDYEINRFDTDESGKYLGQSTGLVKTLDDHSGSQAYRHVILIDNSINQVYLIDSLTSKEE